MMLTVCAVPKERSTLRCGKGMVCEPVCDALENHGSAQQIAAFSNDLLRRETSGCLKLALMRGWETVGQTSCRPTSVILCWAMLMSLGAANL